MGFPVGWTIPDDEEFAKDDDLDTLRYHALGNAVTPPVAAWLAARVKKYLREEESKAGASEKVPIRLEAVG